MGNPTAAQEPSMEEILASIRQIISEDGDAPENDEATEAAGNEPEADDQPTSEAVDDTPPASDDGQDFDLSAEAAADPEPALLDIAAGAIDENSEAGEDDTGSVGSLETMEPSAKAKESDDLVDTGPYESPFDTFNEKIKQTAIEAPENAEPQPEAVPADDEVVSEVATPDDQSPEPAATEPEPTASDPAGAGPASTSPQISESPAMSAPAPKPAEFERDDKLISPESGASVANAFSTLTHTILSQNARTLDDLVSDMLQPMLKDWLDENLPTLVERLVKQEIDRMARGGRG